MYGFIYSVWFPIQNFENLNLDLHSFLNWSLIFINFLISFGLDIFMMKCVFPYKDKNENEA